MISGIKLAISLASSIIDGYKKWKVQRAKKNPAEYLDGSSSGVVHSETSYSDLRDSRPSDKTK